MKTTAKMPASLHKAVKLGMSTVLATGTFAIIGANPAQANPCTLLNFNGCNFSGAEFDVTGVTFSGFTGGALDFLGFTIAGNTLTAQISSVGGITTPVPSGSLSYTISLKNGRTFSTAAANITGSLGTFNTTTSTTGVSASSTNGLGPTVNFSPAGLTNRTFTQTFSATGGMVNLSSVGAVYGTTGPLTAPGPLPLLGVGAAFGFSRKLRRRIQLSA